jgi:hypothetical protein
MSVSRQRRWQIKQHAEHKCIICAEPAVSGYHCEEHRRQVNLGTRERERIRGARSRRYLGAESYHFDRVKAEAAHAAS